jgi:hypothetical protein
MAELIPAVMSQDVVRSERLAAKLLEQLSPGWTVHHSVAWASRLGSKPIQGEVDFVLTHMNHGILAVEVKGGLIELHKGVWSSTQLVSKVKNKIKNPIDQANKNKFAMRNKLVEALNLPKIRVGQIVIFPDSEFNVPNSVSLERSQILDITKTTDKREFESFIIESMKLQDVYRSYSNEEWKKINSCLSPTVKIESFESSAIRKTRSLQDIETTKIIEMTQEQLEVLREMSSKTRLGITGAAGTGKTVLALEQAIRNGKESKVLFISGKGGMVSVLSSSLRKRGIRLLNFSDAGPGVVCIGVDKLVLEVRRHVSNSGVEVYLPKKAGNQRKPWRLKRDFELCLPAIKSKFDTIILDEAQEMHPDVLNHISGLLKRPDESPFWIFFDPKQSFHENWRPPFESQYLALTKNCRNTLEIQKTYSTLVSVNPKENTIESGIEPAFITIFDDEDPVNKIKTLAQDLSAEVQTTRYIQILGMKEDPVLRKYIKIEGFARKKKFASFNTVSTFKGREADVVILYLNFSFEHKDWSRKFYEGASRAKLKLVVVGGPKEISAAINLGSVDSSKDIRS